MKKAFDQNVSRAKPRVRLGAFAAEVQRLKADPSQDRAEDPPENRPQNREDDLARDEHEEAEESSSRPVREARVRKLEARSAEVTPLDLAGERRARADRAGPRRLASEVVEVARTAPAILRDRPVAPLAPTPMPPPEQEERASSSRQNNRPSRKPLPRATLRRSRRQSGPCKIHKLCRINKLWMASCPPSPPRRTASKWKPAALDSRSG